MLLLCCVFVLTNTIPTHMALHAIESIHLDTDIKLVIKGYQVPEFLKHDHTKLGLESANQCDFCFVSNALEGGLVLLKSWTVCRASFSFDIKQIESANWQVISSSQARGPPAFS